MREVIFVNGKPRAGKDSVVQAMSNILMANGVATACFSSIDPVRDMMTNAGFDLSQKTEADRALLAEVGDSVEMHSQVRTRACVDTTMRFFEDLKGSGVMFLHIREALVINRVERRLDAIGGIKRSRIQVVSPRAENVNSNHADLNTGNMGYDLTISNDGTLDDLARKCDKALLHLGLISQLSLLH